MLTKYTRKILKDYKSIRDKKEEFKGHTMAKLIKEDFPKYLEKITPNSSEYKFVANAGKVTADISWTAFPTIAVLNSRISKKLGEGFFIIFIYDVENNRVYLSLTENIRSWKTEILSKNASNHREKLEFNDKFGLEKLSLDDPAYYYRYQYANIYAKCYYLENLPSEEEFVSDYLEILEIYNHLIDIETGIVPGKEPGETPPLPIINIRNSLEDLLKNYKPAKDNLLSNEEKQRIKDVLGTQLPDYLNEITEKHYKLYSSTSDKFHFCPYIALMNEKVTRKHTAGFFVNYMLREDMSGVYLALRHGVEDIKGIKDLKNDLKSKSKEYRNIIHETEVSPNFTDKIDLKYKNATYAPFYEAGTVYSKFYEANKLPSEEELKADLYEMLNLYDILIESILNKFKSFNDYLNHENFLYSSETVENFLLSLKVKPFVILTGNSGTGKTKIAQLFAEYLKFKLIGDYRIIPVGANWTENRHLMGFNNVITNEYHSTPALELLIEASEDDSTPYFLVLDEMNLSHVERYFSDFLSSMESDQSIPLYITNEDKEEDIGDSEKKKPPENLKIPKNVFVIGTVNVDETTYMFSPKVLDRANTIEFITYPAKNYVLGDFDDYNLQGNLKYLENPLSGRKVRKCKIDKLRRILYQVESSDGKNIWNLLAEQLQSFQEVLAITGFDFGFRVIDEILRFMYVAWEYENSPSDWSNWQRYFDAQIMQKMLPKVHGSQRELDIVLEQLFKLCYDGDYQENVWYDLDLEENHLIYPISADKLQRLGKILYEKRYVSFTD